MFLLYAKKCIWEKLVFWQKPSQSIFTGLVVVKEGEVYGRRKESFWVESLA